MKRRLFLIVVLLAGCVACSQKNQSDPVSSEWTIVSTPSPQPTVQISKVALNAKETEYSKAVNRFAFKLFYEVAKSEQQSLMISPLSLQYALSMAANGASAKTLQEILDALGFGTDGLDALNAYSRKLLEQLPAVDLDVKLSLADALIVNERSPLDSDYASAVRGNYYAAVQNMSFTDPQKLVDAINKWASDNTNGLIDKMMEADQVDPYAIAYLMNALYFKAKWASEGDKLMFYKESTYDEEFFPGGCDVLTIPTMHARHKLRYADLEGFSVVELPYSGGKFAMYILLPDNEIVGDPDPEADFSKYYCYTNLLKDLPSLDWSMIEAGMKPREVDISLPKFETYSSFNLNDAISTLGITQMFNGGFDHMFAPREGVPVDAAVSKVLQKARISLEEWGTEAGAVTVMEMKEYAVPGEEGVVKFRCDHSFIWLIAEKTSGVILFQGAFRGN